MYQPAEDSIFFAEFLKSYFASLDLHKSQNTSYLDMGTGSGILSETASKFIKKQNILAADIDKKSVELLKKKGFNAIKTDLFSNIKEKLKFDLITFNAPYLPAHKHDKKLDTTGGKKGDEISLKFLKQAKQHINEGGRIFLLISSHTPQNKIKKYKPKIIAKKKLFFEELLILEFN